MKKSVFIILSICIVLNGCSSEKDVLTESAVENSQVGFMIAPSASENPQLQNYLDFINNRYDGVITLQHNGRIGSPVSANRVVGTPILTSMMPTDIQNDCGYNISLGGLTLACRENNHYLVANNQRREIESLFGQTVQLEVNKAGEGTDISQSFYIPQQFKFGAPTPVFDEINIGTTITWNTDPLNTQDLIMILDYMPTNHVMYAYDVDMEYEQPIIDANPNRISYAKMIPDVGSYTFASGELAPFNEHMVLKLWLIRGTHRLIQGETTNDIIAFAAYTNQNHYFRYKL